VVDTIARLIETFVDHRQEGERFIDTYRRIGIEPYKAKVYGEDAAHAAAATA
jgi:sulfite reductase (NADPH) hemoprotein beta-component